jgi:ERCC4-type nuclease
MFKITIDCREKLLIDICKDKGISIHIKQLDIGDIIITDKDDKVFCIMERKSLTDLSSSIRDGRYSEQKNRLLKNFSKKNIMYLIEDYISFSSLALCSKKVESSIIHSLFRDEIKIMFTINANDTVAAIVSIFDRIVAHPEYFVENITSNESVDKNEGYFSMQGVKKCANDTIDNIQKKMLCQIPSISEQTANGILLKYKSFQSLITFVNSHNEEDVIKELNNIKINNRKISKKVIINIIKYLTMPVIE